MLATNPVVTIPDPVETHLGPQVINVPVRPLRHLAMVRDAGAHASRPERAAYVNIETTLKLHEREFPDLDLLFPGTKKD
jgi:hypothetical protein